MTETSETHLVLLFLVSLKHILFKCANENLDTRKFAKVLSPRSNIRVDRDSIYNSDWLKFISNWIRN